MTDKMSELDEQRKRNAIEMDERVSKANEWLHGGDYPMKPDNPCRTMTDEELRSLIRSSRKH